MFESFPYQAASWSTPRWVVVKCEVTAQGINQRAVVSNRPGVQTLPQGIYDEYCGWDSVSAGRASQVAEKMAST